jgi:predicted negative regulator of RcsB-dependent stress response
MRRLEEMNNGKPFWKSRTIWFNVVAIVVVIAGIFGYAEFEADPQLVTLAAVIGNLILRFMTGEPIVSSQS